MIRFARVEDIERIKELWDESFEYDDFAKWYFTNAFDIDNVLVCEMDNNIVAALQRIPFKLKGVGDATYIYGASTCKKYRNRGIMSKLLVYSEAIDIASGVDAIFLVPENKSLFDFYEKKGYSKHFYKYLMDSNEISRLGLDKKGNYNIRVEEITQYNKENWEKYALDMVDVYIKANENRNYIIRSQKMFLTQISMHVETQGKVYVFYYKDKMIGYTFGFEEDNVYEISELALDNMKYINSIIKILKTRVSGLKILNLLNGNIKVKYGCIKLLRKMLNVNKIIINLVFD